MLITMYAFARRIQGPFSEEAHLPVHLAVLEIKNDDIMLWDKSKKFKTEH